MCRRFDSYRGHDVILNHTLGSGAPFFGAGLGGRLLDWWRLVMVVGVKVGHNCGRTTSAAVAIS